MSIIWAFYCRKVCMEKFCKSLREHARRITDFEKEQMLPLTSHQDANVCYICGRRIFKKFAKSKNCQKVSDHCHYAGKYGGSAHRLCN